MSIEYRDLQTPRSRGAQCQHEFDTAIHITAPLEREKGLTFSYRHIAPLERKQNRMPISRQCGFCILCVIRVISLIPIVSGQ